MAKGDAAVPDPERDWETGVKGTLWVVREKPAGMEAGAYRASGAAMTVAQAVSPKNSPRTSPAYEAEQFRSGVTP